MKAKRKILIFRPDNIGDVLLFTGALKCIRGIFPDAHITLAVQSHVINMVQLCPWVDAIMASEDLLRWKKLVGTKYFRITLVRRLFKNCEHILNLLRSPFDLVVFPLRSPSVDHLETLYYLCPKEIYGIAGSYSNSPPSGFPAYLDPYKLFSKYLDVSKYSAWKHELAVTNDFLQILGDKRKSLGDFAPIIWCSDKDFADADEVVSKEEGPIIGVFPGAGQSYRTWETDNYKRVAQRIRSSSRYIIFGGRDDKTIAREVESKLKAGNENISVINLTGRTSLRELYCLIKRCSVLISMETAGLHFAIAAGVPVVGIVGGGHYGRFIPWGKEKKVTILTSKKDCFHCNWECIFEKPKCIQDVSADDVAGATESYLRLELSLG